MVGPRQRRENGTQGGAVWGQDEVGKTMPVACRDREEAMPDTWWRARVWWT
jgi:hypothetical protein